jgi:hypothetical protein
MLPMAIRTTSRKGKILSEKIFTVKANLSLSLLLNVTFQYASNYQ